MITVLDELPGGIERAKPTELADMCEELTVIHLPGLRPRPVVVSLMLHGNEPAGLKALQYLLTGMGLRPGSLPRALTLLIGNVSAARANVRMLGDQSDFNRIWGEPTGRPVWVLSELKKKSPLCLLDLHNSSGHNPHFAGITRIDRRTLGLAHAFSRHVVHVSGPTGMLAQAASAFTPAMTLECGAPHDEEGFRIAAATIAELLACDDLPLLPAELPTEVLENLVTFRLAEGTEHGRDIRLVDNLEHLNFRDLPIGTPLASAKAGVRWLTAWDNDGEELSKMFLRFERAEVDGPGREYGHDGYIRTTSPFVPVMLTLHPQVMVQDCVGYAMKRRRVLLGESGEPVPASTD